MKKILITLVTFIVLSPAFVLPQELAVSEKQQIEGEVSNIFKTIIDLWYEGKYDSLYEYGQLSSQASLSREDFIRQMKNKKWGLVCCWEKVQDITINVKYPTLVYVRAKIGYALKGAVGSPTNIKTETYQIIFEDRRWRINLLNLLYAP